MGALAGGALAGRAVAGDGASPPYSFTCTTFAGGKPLKYVAEALA
jgi:hypothetical protein